MHTTLSCPLNLLFKAQPKILSFLLLLNFIYISFQKYNPKQLKVSEAYQGEALLFPATLWGQHGVEDSVKSGPKTPKGHDPYQSCSSLV